MDQTNFSLPVHEKLAEQHFELDSATKMRNHLAEDVLDKMMLFLMQVNSFYIYCDQLLMIIIYYNLYNYNS